MKRGQPGRPSASRGLVVVPGETVVDVVAATADRRRRDARVRVVDIEIGVRGNEYDGVAATDQPGGQRLQRQGHALCPEAGAGGIYPVGRGQSPGRAQPAPDARAHDPVAADPANVAHEARLEHDGTQHFQVLVAAGRRAAGVHLAEHLVRRGGNLQCPLQRPLGVRAQVRAVVLAIQFVDDEDPQTPPTRVVVSSIGRMRRQLIRPSAAVPRSDIPSSA